MAKANLNVIAQWGLSGVRTVVLGILVRTGFQSESFFLLHQERKTLPASDPIIGLVMFIVRRGRVIGTRTMRNGVGRSDWVVVCGTSEKSLQFLSPAHLLYWSRIGGDDMLRAAVQVMAVERDAFVLTG